MKRSLTALALALAAAVPLSAQMDHEPMGDMQHGASLAAVRGLYQTVRGNIVASAEQMPEADYAFRPTPEVRSFGQLIGHVANAQYLFCAPVLGETPPRLPDAEQLTSKTELVSAVEAAFAYCDRAYEVDPMKAEGPLKFFGQDHTGLSVLAFNMGHVYEHYGNIVTYLRLKGMVPPSSQPRG